MVADRPDPQEVPQLLALWKQAFGEHDGFWEMFLETGFSFDRCRCMKEAGPIAAALCWFDVSCGEQKFAYLYAVVTHPDFRGKGLCRRLMEDTHSDLYSQGYAGVLLVPAEEGLRAMYRKMGYRTCCAVSEFSCAAADTAIPLRTVSAAEYAALRRRLLPKGSAIQEGENLTFLAAQAELLAGENCLLAAWREGDTLHCIELLGDASAASGIVKALGCKEGYFRTPGKDKPFAMGRPLTESATVPGYFGLAFD